MAALNEPSPTLRATASALNGGDSATSSAYFETLGYRYLGPVDGHDVLALEAALDEAKAYVAHPVLGRRLVECARILTGLRSRSAEEVFGGIDAMKLRSSMTLFARADPAIPEFQRVLDAYFAGEPDRATDRLLDG